MGVALAHLEPTTRTLKRAQYEAFAFWIQPEGVRVRNESHADPSEHEYLIEIEDGLPVACECPADQSYDGACKHQVAVAIREPVLNAATARAVATDGGVAASTEAGDDDIMCNCADLSDDFPCWECFRTGRKPLPADVSTLADCGDE